MTTTTTTDIADDIAARLRAEIAIVGRYHESPTEVVEAGPIVTDHYRAATLISDDHDLGTTWDLGAGLTLTTSWHYAPDDESGRYPIVDAVIDYDDDAAAQLKADAMATLRSNVAAAVAALAARTDIDLTDPDEIIEALDDAGIRAWTSGQNIDEYGIEVDTNTDTGLVELSCWCYDPTNLDAVDQGDVLTVAVDLDAIVQAHDPDRYLAIAARAIEADGLAQWFPATKAHFDTAGLAEPTAVDLLATWLAGHPDAWELNAEDEVYPHAEAAHDLDRAVLAIIGHDLAATAEQELDAVLTNAIDALAGEAVNLLSADQIIEVLRELGFRADPYGRPDTEFGVEVGKVPSASHDRIVMSAWCWDPRQVPVDDTLSTGWVDVAAVVTAARLRDARRALSSAERSFALSAAAAQAAGSATWQDIAGMHGVKDRTTAAEWVRRQIAE